jgi:hypothetical protein
MRIFKLIHYITRRKHYNYWSAHSKTYLCRYFYRSSRFELMYVHSDYVFREK